MCSFEAVDFYIYQLVFDQKTGLNQIEDLNLSPKLTYPVV